MTARIAGHIMERVTVKENAMNKTSVEMGICPRCKKPLNLSHPDTIDFEGNRFHSECAKKAGAAPNTIKANASNY
jgi:hypothetical protein